MRIPDFYETACDIISYGESGYVFSGCQRRKEVWILCFDPYYFLIAASGIWYRNSSGNNQYASVEKTA